MKIALYGQSINPDFFEELTKLFDLFKEKQIESFVYLPFLEYLGQDCDIHPEVSGVFEDGDDLPGDVAFLLSLGGDGTLLKSFLAAKNRSIPHVGINSGRLGFLSDISRDEIERALNDIMDGNIIIDERTVLELEIITDNQSEFQYALNEITVTKLDSSSMINIHTYINNEFLNTYWADGLIVATPTGSTAYSLSVGGPILTPDSENFVISPIAPHNLTVRPLVVPDHHSITLKVEGRGLQFLTSVDSQSEAINFSVLLKIRKASFKVKTIRLNDHSFFTTLRNKLMWGVDKRN
jgi:NAD+ kinase